jgi:hypothetical protein
VQDRSAGEKAGLRESEVKTSTVTRPGFKIGLRPTQANAIPTPKLDETVDHAALGDAARNAGDYRTALGHYRALSDFYIRTARLAALQKAVEGDTEERMAGLMSYGRYDEAIKLIDGWKKEFPASQRLEQLRQRVERARSQ